MNREIYTYTDMSSLRNAPFWDQIRRYPQITVTADFCRSLRETGGQEDGSPKDQADVQICEFRKLSEAVLPHWIDDETKFHEMIVLAQYIRGQTAKFRDDPDIRHWLVGCRRNLGMILSSIILLEEAGIAPEDIHADGDRNIGLLAGAWRFLEQNDPAIDAFHKRMEELTERNAWEPLFYNLFGRADIQTLVFHGFYYFTPLQERIMRLLESTGVRLIFLFPYDERYPYAHEIWRKTYSADRGYPESSDWHMQRGSEADPYGEIFEGRKASVPNELQTKEYASVMEFVRGIKRAKEQGYSVYSSNAGAANEILKDFYPEEYGDRKLLAYPIGQFVSVLNQMWDEDLQEVVLDEDRLIECFASGWLAADGVSGKRYLQDLTYVLPFFSDCRKAEEWETRIALLRDIRENAVEPFAGDLHPDKNTARWQELMGNPFLNFSVFSVDSDKLDVILRLIGQLLSMAGELFGDARAVRVQEHIRKLDRILKQHEMSNELYDEERDLVKDLFEKLRNPFGFTEKVFPADISAALNLYMSGRLREGEIQSDRAGMVLPLYRIGGAAGKNGRVHVCLCDVDNMPGEKKEYVWPLTGRHIKDCYARTGNPLIVNLQHIMEENHICNRYFMYTALKNADVQLSWVSSMDNRLSAPSPYIRLVCEAAGIRAVPAARDTLRMEKCRRRGTDGDAPKRTMSGRCRWIRLRKQKWIMRSVR